MTTFRLHPSRTAVLMVELQEEYFLPGGANELPSGPAALVRAAELLMRARESGARIVHVRRVAHHPLAEGFRAGTAAADIRPEVAPRDGEEVVDKRMLSAFAGTGLDSALRGRAIDAVVIAGFMTHTCCAATAHEAIARGYRALLAEDATAAAGHGPDSHAQVHERALATQRHLGAEVRSASAIRELLAG